MSAPTPTIRLDKWLWAARFFKTRALAKTAVEGGKVHYNDQRAKVSKVVELNAKLTIRQGTDVKEVVVSALSELRKSAPEAQLLYQETEASIDARIEAQQQRRLQQEFMTVPDHKPNKKERRDISRFKQQQDF